MEITTQQSNKIKPKRISSSVGEIYIYSDIETSSYNDDSVSPVDIINDLNTLDGITQLNIRINSSGGSVSAGQAIINQIREFKNRTGCKIIAYIDGIAASMACTIAMVADIRIMPENAMILSHKPRMEMAGDANDYEKAIETLDKFENTIISLYMQHYKGTEEELRNLLAEDRWMSAKEAFECGLCSQISEELQITASTKGIVIKNHEFIGEFYKKLKTKETKTEDKSQPEQSTAINIDAITATTKINTINEFVIALNEAGITSIGECKKIEDLTTNIKGIINLQNDKVKAYDAIHKDLINKAVFAGVRAQGTYFKADKWKTTMSNLNIEEINALADAWNDIAKIALNAGGKVSEHWESLNLNKLKDEENTNYNF